MGSRAALAALALLLASSGCKVCRGACAADQGRVVTGVAPAADGSLTITTCDLTTSGDGSKTSGCRQAVLPPPSAPAGGAP